MVSRSRECAVVVVLVVVANIGHLGDRHAGRCISFDNLEIGLFESDHWWSAAAAVTWWGIFGAFVARCGVPQG